MLMDLKEYRREPERLADRLPWAGLVAPGIVEQKDGLLQRTIEFRGSDLQSATDAGLVGEMARLNNALKRLGSGWSVFVEAQRRQAREYPGGEFDSKVARLVDQERRRMFEAEGSHYESRYYLTLCYRPPKEQATKVFGWLFEGGEQERGDPGEYLGRFREKTQEIVELLRGVFPYVHPMGDEETLTYLKSTVSTNRHRVRVPETPVHLDAVLPDQRVEAGMELKLGEKFVKTMTIRSFPSTTTPGILDALNRLGFPYRWVSRYICLDKSDAVSRLKKYQKQWYSKRKGLFSLFSEALGAGSSDLVNSDAVEKAEDADVAVREVQNDYVSYGYLTTTITVWGSTRKQAEQRQKAVTSTVQGEGFSVIGESFNSLQAWLSSHPGNVYANVRRPLVSSLNLAHMLPVSAVWSGPEKNEHLDAPPHFMAKTTGRTPFRVTTNVGDVGHTLVLGPTGSGKSTLLSLMALQWLRYEDGQVVFFDKGRSARASTLAVGGEFYDLSLGGDVALQPLSDVDDAEERAWARDWIVEILEMEGLEVGPDLENQVWQALKGLGDMPREQRTMFALQNTIQSRQARQVLEDYTQQGPYGSLFDADEETIGLSRWVTLEMSELMETTAVVAPTLRYLFHRVESRFTGAPTLLVLDEAWLFLDQPEFAEKIREWLKVLRKKNVYVVFATQQVSDAMESDVASAIVESCLSRVFLPNSKAREPSVAEYYREMGLNEQQVRLLAEATPKKEYYFDSDRGSRMFQLGLEETPATLAVTGSSDPADQELMDEIVSRVGGGGRDFAERFFEAKEIGWAANLVRRKKEGESYSDTVADDRAEPLHRVFSEQGGER
jgi:type IV secretion system protein VirB4